MTRKPHKHAELIKAWADGAEIERYDHEDHGWIDDEQPAWYFADQYRIKREPKADFVQYGFVANGGLSCALTVNKYDDDNLKLIFDGETGALKDAKVLK